MPCKKQAAYAFLQVVHERLEAAIADVVLGDGPTVNEDVSVSRFAVDTKHGFQISHHKFAEFIRRF